MNKIHAETTEFLERGTLSVCVRARMCVCVGQAGQRRSALVTVIKCYSTVTLAGAVIINSCNVFSAAGRLRRV